MKKLSLYVFVGLMFFNITLAGSLLPNCEGTDSFKWTNCFGSEKKNIAYDLLYKDKYKNKKILYKGEYKSGKCIYYDELFGCKDKYKENYNLVNSSIIFSLSESDIR